MPALSRRGKNPFGSRPISPHLEKGGDSRSHRNTAARICRFPICDVHSLVAVFIPTQSKTLVRPQTAIQEDSGEVSKEVRVTRFAGLLAALRGPDPLYGLRIGVLNGSSYQAGSLKVSGSLQSD